MKRRRRRKRRRSASSGIIIAAGGFLILVLTIWLAVLAADQRKTAAVSSGKTVVQLETMRETAEAPFRQRDPNYMVKIDPAKPMVALTYDDGPYDKVTGKILDKLDQYGGHATFFMVGKRAEKYPALLQRMADQGCELANHTYDHTSMNQLNPDELKESLLHTNQIIYESCGRMPVLMRPVGGNKNAAGLTAVGQIGMTAIMWSVDTLDWKTRDAASTLEKVRTQVKDGDIILMHDLYEETAEASMMIIDELASQGYQLVTVSELASYRGGIEAGNVYSKFRP